MSQVMQDNRKQQCKPIPPQGGSGTAQPAREVAQQPAELGEAIAQDLYVAMVMQYGPSRTNEDLACKAFDAAQAYVAELHKRRAKSNQREG